MNEVAHISKNLAGSDVPWVTERKTFWYRIREKVEDKVQLSYHVLFSSPNYK